MEETLETQLDMLSIAYRQECLNHDETRAKYKTLQEQLKVVAMERDMLKAMLKVLERKEKIACG